MPKYYSRSYIIHDGLEYRAGQAINLELHQAAPLLKMGAVVTEDQAKQAEVVRQEIKTQEGAIKQKDAEIAELRAEMDKMRAGQTVIVTEPNGNPTDPNKQK